MSCSGLSIRQVSVAVDDDDSTLLNDCEQTMFDFSRLHSFAPKRYIELVTVTCRDSMQLMEKIGLFQC